MPTKKATPPEEWPPPRDGLDQAIVWTGPYKGDWIWFEDKWQKITDDLMKRMKEYYDELLGLV